MTNPKPGQGPGVAWRGRQGHASNTRLWLDRAKGQAARWTAGGLSDQAIVDLVESLPTLARNKPDLFVASAELLKAQSPDPRWLRAMNLRLAVVIRAVELKRESLGGDLLAIRPRKDAWVGTKKRHTGQWAMQDGRDLPTFMKHGGVGRTLLWETMTALPRLTYAELPTKHLGLEAWAKAMLDAQQLLNSDHPKVVESVNSGRTWSLAVRRVKKLGVRGLFVPNLQLVVVDPRHPETLLHELGHWLLDHSTEKELWQGEQEVHDLINSATQNKR